MVTSTPRDPKPIQQLFVTRYYRISEHLSRKHPDKLFDDQEKLETRLCALLDLLCIYNPQNNRPPLSFGIVNTGPLLLWLLVCSACNIYVGNSFPNVRSVVDWHVQLIDEEQLRSTFVSDSRNFCNWFLDHQPFVPQKKLDKTKKWKETAIQTAALLSASAFNIRFGILGLPSLAYARRNTDETVVPSSTERQKRKRRKASKRKKQDASEGDDKDNPSADSESDDSLKPKGKKKARKESASAEQEELREQEEEGTEQGGKGKEKVTNK